jgi:hypothetical protein
MGRLGFGRGVAPPSVEGKERRELVVPVEVELIFDCIEAFRLDGLWL